MNHNLLSCPFCGEDVMYKIERVDYLGTVIPQLFCNSCKMIIEIENDSTYLNDKKTEDYLKEKLYKQFNTRKPMERIIKRIENARQKYQRLVREQGEKEDEAMNIHFRGVMQIVKEEGGIE